MGNYFYRGDGAQRVKVIAETLLVYYLFVVRRIDPPFDFIEKLNNAAINSSLEPWHWVALSLFGARFMSQLPLLLDLHAPVRTLTERKEYDYSPAYTRVRRILCAQDAGMLNTSRIRWKPLRDMTSMIFSAYYFINGRAAEDVVNRYMSVSTVEMVRIMWEKGNHPAQRYINGLSIPKMTLFEQPLLSLRDDRSVAEHLIFYSGSIRSLSRCQKCIIQVPGGGFIAMQVRNSSQWAAQIAHNTGLPVIAQDYRKAPQHPYPYGFEDCFRAIYQIVSTHGAMAGLGMVKTMDGLVSSYALLKRRNAMLRNYKEKEAVPKGTQFAVDAQIPRDAGIFYQHINAFQESTYIPRNFEYVLMGDSAGGNLATSSLLRLLLLQNHVPSNELTIAEQDFFDRHPPVNLPKSLHQIYPVLNLGTKFWQEREALVNKQKAGIERVLTNTGGGFHTNYSHSTDGSILGKEGVEANAMTIGSVLKGPARDTMVENMLSPLQRQMNAELRRKSNEKGFQSYIHPLTLSELGNLHAPNAGGASNGQSPLPLASPIPQLTTRTQRAGDPVLPMEFQLLIASSICVQGGAPCHDMFISPILAPDHLISQFPPTLIHVGNRDPLEEDSHILFQRLNQQQEQTPSYSSAINWSMVEDVETSTNFEITTSDRGRHKLIVIPGVSHAYMNVFTLLPEGIKAMNLTSAWALDALKAQPKFINGTKKDLETLAALAVHSTKAAKRGFKIRNKL